MKIQYKIGNLLHANEQYIAHGVNSIGIAGAGVAKGIKEYYPDAYIQYKELCGSKAPTDLLGTVQFIKTSDKIIINCFTQLGVGGIQPVSYEALTLCVKAINDEATVRNFNTVAFPLIGAGLGGGDWKLIEKLIELNSSNFLPVVYKLN